MKKISMIVLLLLLFSCNKQTSELQLMDETAVPENKEQNKVDVEPAQEKKPLIIITKDDVLEIWVRADGAPGMFLNNDNELEGFYVDLDKAVMDEMGQKYNLNPYTDLGPLIQNFKSGDAHSALAIVDVKDYRALAHISTIFETLNFVIFVPENYNGAIPDNKEDAIKSLSGKKVGVQTRAHIYQLLRDYNDIEIVEYPTTTAALEALNNGEVDAVPDVKRIGLYNSKLNNWNIKPIGVPIFSLNIGTGFSKELDTSIVDRYNVALQTLIDSGYVAKLYKEYFGD